MNIYGYCRISTAKQSIDRQIRNIKAEYPTAHIVQEAYTGTSIFRPEWLKLYRVLKAGDTVVFDSVSRMSRNAEEGFALYEDLYHKGIRLVFLKEHHIDTETYKKALSGSIAMTGTNVDFILKGINEYLMALAKEQIKLAFEQSEKEVADLHQRTREGLLTARLNGKQVGRKKGVGFETKKAREAKQIIRTHCKTFGGTLDDAECMKLTGLARNTYYKYKRQIRAELIPGWNINASRWFFKESAGCEAPLDSPILRPDALTSEDQMMMAAVIGLSFLKTRLPEDMQPTKPFAVISESFSITTEITLNCKLAELKKQLNHHRDDLLIHVRGGFASNRYQKATNYDYLSDEAEKGSTSRSIYIVQAKELTPEIREHCIPIQLNPAEACSATTGVDSVTWGDLISLVEGNPNEFDSRVYRAYKEERDRMEGSSFCQEIAVLRAVSEIICWTFSQKASLSEEKVRDAYKTAFDHYPSRWDSMLNTTASDCFRNALYAVAREQTIRFRDIDDLDETYCKEKEVLYDEYTLYLTLDLVKRLAAKHMPEFLTSDVLAQLTEAGILSSSIVKTLTLSTGHSKNVRLRSINRSFVNGHGRRDITTI